MQQDFVGKVALITGGSSGIGLSTAQKFAARGAKTVITGRRIPEGEKAVEHIREQGGEAIFIQADVSREQDVEALIYQTVQAYGRLDYAFNNAGMTSAGIRPIENLTEFAEAEWNQLMDTNVKGVWLCLKYEIPQILKQGGAIVNMSSIYGLKGSNSGGAYATSKHAVLGLTKSAARQFARRGIRVNAVCPGFIKTPLLEAAVSDPQVLADIAEDHALGRLGEACEVAEAVVWLCSDAASFVTGHSLIVDGGYLL